MKYKTLFVILIGSYHIVVAQADSTRSYTTTRLQGDPPKIDGRLDDPAWEQVPWGGGNFLQSQPNPGAPASVATYFKILYDDKNLYIAFRNLDPEPEKIVRRMSRRDGFEGDWVEVNIDSYYDKRTAFSFTPSASGVKGDQYVSNNGDNWDNGWEPIWYLQTAVNHEGWIAEARIPLSQLRFADKPEHTWGLQFTRRCFRKQEFSLWKYIPPDATGWVHHFGDLNGIRGIRPQQQLEVQPYLLARTERLQKEEGNPFATGKDSGIDAGLDAKIGITSDITLDLTVNPDFGQVEADPSQVNLSAFELFFQERRPFFLEGSNTLDFPLSDFNSNNLFYSRRIGRSPQGEVTTDATDDAVDEYVKADTRTTILGAAKLSGKNKKGFSWAILESVTAREFAGIDSLGHRSKVAIEPAANYFVGRAQQDINKGNSIVGAIFTATNRDLRDEHLKWLHKDVYTGGADVVHNWKKRMYFVQAKTFMSHVRGTAEAITNTQRSSERYFQRPDNHHTRLDSSRRSLTGTGGRIVAGKQSGKVIFTLGYSWMSPELELNDMGFLAQTDQMTQWSFLQYRVLKPVGIFRSQRYNLNQFQEWDFGGNLTSRWYNVNSRFELKNLWFVGTGAMYTGHSVSNADLRGGPALRYPGSFNFWIFAVTNQTKKFYAYIEPDWLWGNNHYQYRGSVFTEFTYRPFNALEIAVAPSLAYSRNELQYVATAEPQGEPRYIVAEIDQRTVRLSMRMTCMITPNLSLQYWGQPFGTSGKYSGYKRIADAGAGAYRERIADIPVFPVDEETLGVDERSRGAADYTFGKPDFNFAQFRSNMVLRWEYIPGSTLFLVWTQEKNGAFYDQPGASLHQRYSFDFDGKSHNIFLLKYTYRFVF